MIQLKCVGHNMELVLTHLINVFKPYITEEYLVESIMREDEVQVVLYDSNNNSCDQQYYLVELEKNIHREKERKRLLRIAVYDVLNRLTGQVAPWGILTGIRPTKLVHGYMREGMSENQISQVLRDQFYIREDKIRLMQQIATKEDIVLRKNQENELSVYIGIPFCPSRCLYCSFTAYDIQSKKEKVDQYLEALFKEIDYMAEYSSDKPIRSLYIGGGTPTSLDEVQLGRLLKHIKNRFKIDEIDEYTIEAGRPDTLNSHKLQIIKDMGVGRISINPQTMNQKTLDTIGRQHTVQDIINIFNKARAVGHDNINMDLILGLPDEEIEDVRHTLSELKKLGPESITVHTMAIKRASRLNEAKNDYILAESQKVEDMLNLCQEAMEEMQLEPYYMYRQKNILGNFENVGYAVAGKESIYNIEIMEEKETILAAGAGSVTKIIGNSNKKLQRQSNLKNLEQYIERVGEMIENKKQFLEQI